MRWNTIPSILQWGSIADLCCLLPPGNPLAPGWPGPKVAAWISVVVAALRVALVSPLWQRELHLHLSLKHAHRLVLHSPSCKLQRIVIAHGKSIPRWAAEAFVKFAAQRAYRFVTRWHRP